MSHLPRAFRIQAKACDQLGSPFYGAILNLAADDLEAGGPTLDLMSPWVEASLKTIFDDAAHLRLLGGLHDLVLSGEDRTLSACYPVPGRATDPVQAWAAARAAMVDHHGRLADFIVHEPQTNEVRRSACLAPGFLQIAHETQLPIRAFEIAASAGLNLNWDRYAYRFGEATWGDPESPVVIDCDWEGALPPLDAPLKVIARAACDRRPGDINDPVQRRRLLAYIWPDQFERFERIHAAIALAQSLDVKVHAADAINWTREMATPKVGAATVAYHSVFWYYMSTAKRADMLQTLSDLGARATTAAPFAWLRMEPQPDNMAIMELRLTLWPNGEERILAVVHPHGAWVKWVG